MTENSMKQSNIKQYLLSLGITAGITALLIMAAVVVLDPFYHYHGPILGMPAVLNEKEYQVPGTLKNFEYDAVLAGSSVVENNNNRWYDEAFGCRTIKAVRSYGGVADLCYYVNLAYEHQAVKKVFFNLDPASLHNSPETTFRQTGCPLYLYDHNPFNDVKYIFNKTVLFEKIPYMLAQSLTGNYDEGLSYNWAEGKDFSTSGALSHYYRRKNVDEILQPNTFEDNLRGNIALLEELVEKHPETDFIFFIPPYSMLWWDDAVRSGYLDVYLYDEKEAVRALFTHPNVRIFDFQNDETVITNLDVYMDTVHFSPEINYKMVEDIMAGRNELTAIGFEKVLESTRAFAEGPLIEKMKELEAQDLFLYDD